jgi:hypothetical protein
VRLLEVTVIVVLVVVLPVPAIVPVAAVVPVVVTVMALTGEVAPSAMRASVAAASRVFFSIVCYSGFSSDDAPVSLKSLDMALF